MYIAKVRKSESIDLDTMGVYNRTDDGQSWAVNVKKYL
jgi:hypothetical protein